MSSSSHFSLVRVLGNVVGSSTGLQFNLGSERFFLAPFENGRGWQLFNLDKIRVVATSKMAHLDQISSHSFSHFCVFRYFVLALSGPRVVAWLRSTALAFLETGKSSMLKALTIFGEEILAVDEENVVFVWPLSSLARRSDVVDSSLLSSHLPGRTLQLKNLQTPIIGIVHPITYLNKLLFFSCSELVLVNIITGSEIFRFSLTAWLRRFGLTGAKDQAEVNLICVENSPVLDVVALGFSNGVVLLVNIRFDEVLGGFRLPVGSGSAASLAFRSDSLQHLAVTGGNGKVFIWDLNAREFHSSIEGRAALVAFLPGEPLALVQGADNSLRIFIFEGSEQVPRLLKARAAHSEPPHLIEFYSAQAVSLEDSVSSGVSLLSAGQDFSLRLFALRKAEQSAEFSQKRFSKQASQKSLRIDEFRLGRISALAFHQGRERDWSNIVTAHEGDSAAYTWKFSHKSLSQVKLFHAKSRPSQVSSVAISACGNFAFVGLESGRIDQFNLQSGIFKRSFGTSKPVVSPADQLRIRQAFNGISSRLLNVPVPPKGFSKTLSELLKPEPINRGKTQEIPKSADNEEDCLIGHSGRVSGLRVLPSNNALVSCGLDGLILLWDFPTASVAAHIRIEAPLQKVSFSLDGALVAVSSSSADFLSVFDLSALERIRHFDQLKSPVSSMNFSSDSRLLAVALLDGSLRVYDLPANRLVEWLHFDFPVVSLAFSPCDDFLATAHANQRGIFLWANNQHFGKFSAPTTREKPNKILLMGQTEEEQESDDEESEDFLSQASADSEEPAVEEFPSGLISLSVGQGSKWYSLPNLDAIRSRNQPVAPQAPEEKMPFFLEQFKSSKEKIEAPEGEKKTRTAHRLQSGGSVASCEFIKRISSNASPSSILSWLSSLSPSGVEAEILSVGLDFSRESEEILAALNFFLACLGGGELGNFDLLQGILNVFLKNHGSALSASEPCVQAMREIQRLLAAAIAGLENRAFNCQTAVQTLANTV